MKSLKFTYKDALVSQSQLSSTTKKLQKEISAMKKAAKQEYDDDRASINLPVDMSSLRTVRKVIAEKQKLKPTYIVVVGIGGSNLGTIAVQEAVLGKLHNQLDPDMKILYEDTVDCDSTSAILTIVRDQLERGHTVIINGVSKSGGTTETIANFEILVNLVKKHKKDYHKHIVVTTDKGSHFWKLAHAKGFTTLEIPKKVGGRYSVFSPVGLFPLGMLGIDIGKLLKGAAAMRSQCLKTKNNPAALSASIQYVHHKKGRNISNLFLFSNGLESIGKWYRQLMGESIGKERSKDKKQVFEGITPTVAVGSTDLHSMAQLYLGGPYDKIWTLVRVNRPQCDIKVPKLPGYEDLVDHIEGKTLASLMDAIVQGVEIAFQKGKRPFIEVTLPDKSEASIGQFLQFKMMEMMYLGYLLNVNPFDQPNVESYKVETKRILAKRLR